MAFTTEELLKLGLTKEQASDVFALRGKELNAEKESLTALTQERDSLKEQLQSNQERLSEFEKSENVSSETKKALSDLQTEFDKYKKEAEDTLAKSNKVNAINLALKDIKAHNPASLMKLIDIDNIELDQEGKPKLDDIIKDLKESDPYLFQAEEGGTPNPSIVPPGNPAAGGKVTDPFQAVVDGYK